MALDPEHHRAFLACEENNLMTVFDLDKHAAIAFSRLPSGPDVIKFDAGLGRIYVACYSGAYRFFRRTIPTTTESSKISLFHMLFIALRLIPTPRVYVPEQEEDGKPVARMVVYEAVNR